MNHAAALLSLAFSVALAQAAAPASPAGDLPRDAAFRAATLKHVERIVKKLSAGEQRLRADGIPALSAGDGLCLPCHTLTPGTRRTLKPLHWTIRKGMVPGLTGQGPAGMRAPGCVDCHAYPTTNARVQSGDLEIDMVRKPCLQPQCHSDRTYVWALQHLGRLRHGARAVPTDEFFRTSGLVSNRRLKQAAVIAPWAILFLCLMACLVIQRLRYIRAADAKRADGPSPASRGHDG